MSDGLKNKLLDDLIIYSECAWLASDTSIRYIDPISDELSDAEHTGSFAETKKMTI